MSAQLFTREYVLARVQMSPAGCWEWAAKGGRVLRAGRYGHIGTGGKSFALAHRVSYEVFVGPIPDGLPLDHLCRNTRCVNPAHLEPVTQRENVLRGVGPSAQCARKTHCQRGHELTEENTRHHGRSRRCVPCQKAYDAARHQAYKQSQREP